FELRVECPELRAAVVANHFASRVLWTLNTGLWTRQIPWSNGDDTCVTCRRRWFNSIRDHSRRQESGVRSQEAGGRSQNSDWRTNASSWPLIPDSCPLDTGLHADGGD